MKKLISLITLAVVFGCMASCDSDPSDSSTSAGGTAVKKMAGDWIASVYYCGHEITDTTKIDTCTWTFLGDFDSAGGNYLLTYNTSANKSTEMWVNDNGNLNLGQGDDYRFTAKVNVNYGARTFYANQAENIVGDGKVTIVGGKILSKAATNPDGVKEDSIVFYVKVGGTSSGFIKVSGYRNNF